jgi:hypothetical protein
VGGLQVGSISASVKTVKFNTTVIVCRHNSTPNIHYELSVDKSHSRVRLLRLCVRFTTVHFINELV